MAEQNIKTRIQMKHDVESNWNTAGGKGFVPKIGELIIYDKDAVYSYPRMKIGDGSTNVADLPFIDEEIWNQFSEMESIVAIDDGDCNITLGLSPLPSSEQEEY